jgi:hypothetical protein
MFVRLVIILACMALGTPALAQEDVLWERYFDATHEAFEQGNYWKAHQMFAATTAEAERSGQKVQLAQKLENLAGEYESVHRLKVAEALYRHALRIYENCLSPQHSLLVTSIQKYARVLRNLNREEQASKLEARARDLMASRHG